MAHWVGAQGKVNSSKMQKHALIVTSPSENPKRKKFFYPQLKTCWVRRGFDQLSSSIGWEIMALQTFKKLQKKWRTRDWKGSI